MGINDINGIKIYIAAPIGSIAYVKSIAAELTARGHKITSSWHAGKLLAPTDAGLSEMERSKISAQAFYEIGNSDAMLLIAHKYGRGSLVEAGYAIGMDLYVVALGSKLDVTIMLDRVKWVSFKEDAFAELDRISSYVNFPPDEDEYDWDSDYNDDSDDHG